MGVGAVGGGVLVGVGAVGGGYSLSRAKSFLLSLKTIEEVKGKHFEFFAYLIFSLSLFNAYKFLLLEEQTLFSQ